MSRIYIDDLADYMFVKNKNNIISLTLPLLQSKKDLFYFLFDLFCKGLVILFGNNNRVSIENLTINDFDKIKEKMSYAGIDIFLIIIHIQSSTFSMNFKDLENSPSNLNLKDYEVSMTIGNNLYKISFDCCRI